VSGFVIPLKYTLVNIMNLCPSIFIKMADSSRDMRKCALNKSEILEELFADSNSDVPSGEDEEVVGRAVDSESDEEIVVSRKQPRCFGGMFE
jgi:hypothetical protein